MTAALRALLDEMTPAELRLFALGLLVGRGEFAGVAVEVVAEELGSRLRSTAR